MSEAWDVEATAAEHLDLPVDPAEVEGVVRSVLAAEGVPAAEISIALLGDAEIEELNRRYLDHEGPTDVISFPLHRPGGSPLGDIYVGLDRAVAQAADLGVDPREEVLRLCVHGTLHILGYEHPEGPDRDASPMYLRQEELLAAFLGRAHA